MKREKIWALVHQIIWMINMISQIIMMILNIGTPIIHNPVIIEFHQEQQGIVIVILLNIQMILITMIMQILE